MQRIAETPQNSKMKSIESLQKQSQLVALEKAYDRRALEESFQAALQHSHLNSNCWFPVRFGKSFYNALNQYVVEVEYAADHAVSPDNEFEPGKCVCFFHRDKEGKHPVETLVSGATVQRIEGRIMQLALDVPDTAFQLHRIAEHSDVGVRIAFDDGHASGQDAVFEGGDAPPVAPEAAQPVHQTAHHNKSVSDHDQHLVKFFLKNQQSIPISLLIIKKPYTLSTELSPGKAHCPEKFFSSLTI